MSKSFGSNANLGSNGGSTTGFCSAIYTSLRHIRFRDCFHWLLAIIGIVRGRRRAVVWMVAVASIGLWLSPFFTSKWVWDWIVAKNGLIEEP